MTWTVPRMWEGETVAVLASGESMTQAVADRVRAAGVRTIVINNTWQRAPLADLLYAADAAWWAEYHADTAEFAGLKVSAEATPYPDVLQINETGKHGFDPDPGSIRSGGNGGYAGVHIAAHAGGKPILLCGFDMRGGHWHGPHRATLRNNLADGFPRWIERFRLLAPELESRGIEVLNCTPDSALRCFPMANLEEVLARRVLVTRRAGVPA